MWCVRLRPFGLLWCCRTRRAFLFVQFLSPPVYYMLSPSHNVGAIDYTCERLGAEFWRIYTPLLEIELILAIIIQNTSREAVAVSEERADVAARINTHAVTVPARIELAVTRLFLLRLPLRDRFMLQANLWEFIRERFPRFAAVGVCRE